MYDGVLLASEELERRPGRRVIILISDGGDTTSYTTFLKSLEAAHAADAVVYGLTVTPIKADAGRNVGGENAIRMFAAGTGGEAFVEYGEEALNRAFDQILDNLRTQYLLGYYPPEHSDRSTRFRRIEVRVDRAAGKILARDGYYVPEPRRILPESAAPAADVSPHKGRWRTVEEKAAAEPKR
jgi:Ca-activated chloride channel family protein